MGCSVVDAQRLVIASQSVQDIGHERTLRVILHQLLSRFDRSTHQVHCLVLKCRVSQDLIAVFELPAVVRYFQIRVGGSAVMSFLGKPIGAEVSGLAAQDGQS